MKNKFKRRHKYALYHISIVLSNLQDNIAQIRDGVPVSDDHSDADQLLLDADNHLNSVIVILDRLTADADQPPKNPKKKKPRKN